MSNSFPRNNDFDYCAQNLNRLCIFTGIILIFMGIFVSLIMLMINLENYAGEFDLIEGMISLLNIIGFLLLSYSAFRLCSFSGVSNVGMKICACIAGVALLLNGVIRSFQWVCYRIIDINSFRYQYDFMDFLCSLMGNSSVITHYLFLLVVLLPFALLLLSFCAKSKKTAGNILGKVFFILSILFMILYYITIASHDEYTLTMIFGCNILFHLICGVGSLFLSSTFSGKPNFNKPL